MVGVSKWYGVSIVDSGSVVSRWWRCLDGGGICCWCLGGDSPMRPPSGRHESSTRSMRKGDSLTGTSLSRVLSPSPTLNSPPGRGSPAVGVLEEEQEEPLGSSGGSMFQKGIYTGSVQSKMRS